MRGPNRSISGKCDPNKLDLESCLHRKERISGDSCQYYHVSYKFTIVLGIIVPSAPYNSTPKPTNMELGKSDCSGFHWFTTWNALDRSLRISIACETSTTIVLSIPPTCEMVGPCAWYVLGGNVREFERLGEGTITKEAKVIRVQNCGPKGVISHQEKQWKLVHFETSNQRLLLQ